MSLNYTKGPWRYGRANNYEGFYVAPQMSLPTLSAVEVFNYPDNTESNAKLIAASPELFENLSDIIKIINDSPLLKMYFSTLETYIKSRRILDTLME